MVKFVEYGRFWGIQLTSERTTIEYCQLMNLSNGKQAIMHEKSVAITAICFGSIDKRFVDWDRKWFLATNRKTIVNYK